MNLRDLRYLVALADHRHFGKAAAACFVSQPTLSTQIRKLEEELGVAVVERAPRKVMLTPAGRDIADRARKIVADVEQMKEAARRSQDPEAGTVRLGMFPTLGPYLLPHVVPGIRARFPQLELLLVEEKSDVLLSRLREGRLDFATDPAGAFVDSSTLERASRAGRNPKVDLANNDSTGFFEAIGYEVAERAIYPEKIRRDCLGCARRTACREICVRRSVGLGMRAELTASAA